jgi:hypothetical protein
VNIAEFHYIHGLEYGILNIDIVAEAISFISCPIDGHFNLFGYPLDGDPCGIPVQFQSADNRISDLK